MFLPSWTKEGFFSCSSFPTSGSGGSVRQFSNSPVSCDSTVDTLVDQDPEFFPIPDPGVKKAPDPGSESATLLIDRCILWLLMDQMIFAEDVVD